MKKRAAIHLWVKRKRHVRRSLALVAAALLAWLFVPGASVGAQASGPSAGAAAPVVGAAPGYAVEDFAYPQADKILEERGIVLKRGDGHIVLAVCGTESGLLQVLTRISTDAICFRVTGYLALEILQVYSIRGNDYTTRVDMSVDGEQQSYDIAKNLWTPVGESGDEQGRKYALVEIRASK
jgi:hypothetical protein